MGPFVDDLSLPYHDNAVCVFDIAATLLHHHSDSIEPDLVAEEVARIMICANQYWHKLAVTINGRYSRSR